MQAVAEEEVFLTIWCTKARLADFYGEDVAYAIVRDGRLERKFDEGKGEWVYKVIERTLRMSM